MPPSDSMTQNEYVTTEEVLHERLQEIINSAASNGVDVEGAWPVLNGDSGLPDWDLEIIRLAETGR